MFPKTSSLTRCATLVALLLSHGARATAQTALVPSKDWVVGSDELIRIALTNNLNILISQIQPQLDEYSISGLYGAYQPSFTLKTPNAYNLLPAGFFNEGGLPIPAQSTTEKINSYTAGLSGAA